jgi:hypothetical protein
VCFREPDLQLTCQLLSIVLSDRLNGEVELHLRGFRINFRMNHQNYGRCFLGMASLFFLEWITVLVHGAAPLLEDNAFIRNDIPGRADVSEFSWADSYSDGDSCYCASTFDHDIGSVVVETPLGNMTILDVCTLLGDGPTGSREGHPLYNDIQCGNGPANSAGDEEDCPGRTEYGQEGCKYIGPKWNFTRFLHPPTIAPVKIIPISNPTTAPTAAPFLATLSPTRRPVTTQPFVSSSPSSNPSEIVSSVPSMLPTGSPTLRNAAPILRDSHGIDFKFADGDPKVEISWADSYSFGKECFCKSNFDHGLGDVIVPVPNSFTNSSLINVTSFSVREICNLLGPGPGSNGRPLYNDIQCGNGPSNNNTSGDEIRCPGRTEYGAAGCKFLGPRWNWNKILQLNETASVEEHQATIGLFLGFKLQLTLNEFALTPFEN